MAVQKHQNKKKTFLQKTVGKMSMNSIATEKKIK